MEEPKKWVPALGLILVGLVFSIAATPMPWWSVKTTGEAQLVRNSTAIAEYNLFQTVTASISEDNKTVTLSFLNLTTEEADINALASVSNITLILTIGGSALTALSLVLIVISGLRKPLFTLTKLAAAFAAILLLFAPLYLTFSLPPIVTKFDRVIPACMLALHPLNPREISDFWGSIAIRESPKFPEWSWNTAFWNWGAGFGWYIAFSGALLLFSACAWIHTTAVKEGT